MATQSSPKPADSARPTTGQPTSNLFNAFQPNASANASNYNPYNSNASSQALADQNAAGYWAGQGQLQQAKEAASFGASQGVQTSAAQSANQAASQQLVSQQQSQQQQANALNPALGGNQGRLAFGGVQNNNAKLDIFGRALGTEKNIQDQMRLQQQVNNQSDRTRAIDAANAQQLAGQQAFNDRQMARLQGENQLEAAKVAANAQLGSAALGAQGNMVSSLFGSLGSMVSGIGGGGRHQYW